MHERFSHQHYDDHNQGQHHHRRRRSGSGGADALRGGGDEEEPGVKRRRLLSASDPEPSSARPATSTSPLRLLSFAASAVDPRTEDAKPESVTSSHHQAERLDEAARQQRPANVPVFALHPGGSYYVPLSLDRALMAPYMVVFDAAAPHNAGTGEANGGGGAAPLILHPISINVNFSGPVQVPIAPCHSSHFMTHNFRPRFCKLFRLKRSGNSINSQPSSNNNSSSFINSNNIEGTPSLAFR